MYIKHETKPIYNLFRETKQEKNSLVPTFHFHKERSDPLPLSKQSREIVVRFNNRELLKRNQPISIGEIIIKNC